MKQTVKDLCDGDLEVVKEVVRKSDNTCPVCGGYSKLTCRCLLRDSLCENGHNWFYCPVHQKKIEGMSDHTVNISTCRCIRKKRS